MSGCGRLGPVRRRHGAVGGAFGLLLLGVLAAGPGRAQKAPPSDSARADSLRREAHADSLRREARSGLIPAGFGTLRQGDVAVVVQNLGLQVKAIPLDEAVIRALAPDSYGSLHGLRESRARQLDSVRARLGLPAVQAWYVQYYNVEQGEARFDERDFLVRSAGRDFHPLDVLALTRGFGEGRLAQRQRQEAIYVFDPAIDLTQPLTVTIGTQQSDAWGDIAQRLERERALVWSRAGAAGRQKP